MDTGDALPEIRSVLHRARSNRLVLDQLVEQVPGERWDNRAEGEQWSARVHLAHLATIDDVTRAMLEAGRGREFVMGADVMMQRITLLNEIADRDVADLRARMASSRAAMEQHLAAFGEHELGGTVVVERPGVYPPEQRLSVRAYLASWAEHDAGHTEAIRAAVTAPLQPAALAAAQRIRRRRLD